MPLRVREEAADSLKPFLGTQPLPTGPEEITCDRSADWSALFIVGVPDTTTQNGTSVRIDHADEPRALFGRWNHAPSTTQFAIPARTSRTTVIGLTTVTLGSTTTLTSSLRTSCDSLQQGHRAGAQRQHDIRSGRGPVTAAQFFGGGGGAQT